jgi:signal transduction histidine kinase
VPTGEKPALKGEMMPRRGLLRFTSLRGKLGAAALGGLVTTAVLAGLVLMTAQAATDVVQTARMTHDRVRVFTQLQTAARAYQNASYQHVREPGIRARREVSESRTRFENLLSEAERLPAINAREATVATIVRQQGDVVLEHFASAEKLVEGVDRKWREGGSRAALQEVNRISQPIFALQDTLQGEIRRGDWTVAEATRSAQSLIRSAVIGALLGLAVALAFSLVVHLLLHLRLRPGLRRLEEGAQAFGAGQLAYRIRLAGEDELGRLAGAFDTMAETISNSQHELRAIQAGLEQAVAASTAELRQANAELSAADECRRAFLADVSHELRTPLTVIRGEAQVALRLVDNPSFDPHETFDRILSQTQDLSRMVDDLFLIARAQAGGLPLELTECDLQEIIDRVASDFENLASEAGGSIRARGGRPVFALVDEDRLRRALAALIENSLRHCPSGVNIRLEVFARRGWASIAVCDDGPGLDFAQAQQLFQRFRRGESRGEGSGLGLSLVNALVEAHGGTTFIDASHMGGTRVTMRLPVDATRREAA